MKLAASLTMCAVALSLATATSASTASQREYKRGYADCSKGQYDQYQHGESYKAGCRAAEDKLKSGAYCPPDVSEANRYKYPGCGGGHSTRPAVISDLRGRDSIKVFDIMTSRGFKSVDSITSGETLYGIYFNAATKQCVQVTNANGRVVDARDIHTHPNCH
jgi:hypothetical protein